MNWILASDTELQWWRCSGFVMWLWMCSVSMVVDSLNLSVKTLPWLLSSLFRCRQAGEVKWAVSFHLHVYLHTVHVCVLKVQYSFYIQWPTTVIKPYIHYTEFVFTMKDEVSKTNKIKWGIEICNSIDTNSQTCLKQTRKPKKNRKSN